MFDYFCTQLNAVNFPLFAYFDGKTLKMSNYSLSPETTKALACVLPLISGLEALELLENEISDENLVLLLIAFYMAPKAHTLRISGSSFKRMTCSTLSELTKL